MIDDDRNLITKLKQGDREAFKKLFLGNYTNLCNYAYEFVHDKSLAEDIVSDGFYWIWKNKEKLHIKSSLKSYLYKIVHNRCINHIQQLKVRDRYAQETILLTKSEAHKTIDSSNHPLNLLISKEIQHEISKAVENLPPKCSEIFKLNRFHGLKNKEIAEKLQITELTVKKQLAIALKKIREQLFILLLFSVRIFF